MKRLLGCLAAAALASCGASGSGDTLTIAMMPKSKGNAYFIACKAGAEEAAKELGVTLLWDGPTDPNPSAQVDLADAWISRGVDALAVAVENRDGMASVLKKARAKGIPVITWDADSTAEARSFFVNQATPEGIAKTLVEHAARLLGGKGEYAIITASLTAGNMIEWQQAIEKYNKEKHPDLKRVDLRACDDKQARAFEEAKTILNAHPNCRLIMAICSPAVPGASEAVKQSGRQDVKVIGLGLPSETRAYVKAGVAPAVVLWKTADLGYLTVHAAAALRKGALKPGDRTVKAGRLGEIEIAGDQILLGMPFTFDATNIDRFDF